MVEKLLDNAKVNRDAFQVISLQEIDQEDKEFWASRTPVERFEALELSRQITYGYDPTARGLSRFFEVVDFPPG